MNPQNGSRKWRYAAELLGALLLVLAAAGAVLFWQRGELKWLLAPAPEPGKSRRPVRTAPTPNPSAAQAPQEAAPRTLSLDGLRVERYAGEQAQNPALHKSLQSLEADFLDSVKDLKDGCGLYPTAADKVVLVPRPKSECLFPEAFQVTLQDGGARLEVPVEPLALGWWDTRQLLAAGLAASILLQEARPYAQAPSWVRYGLALELSGLGKTYAQRVLLESDKPPLQLVRPLSEAGDFAWPDGYWAVRALSARKGNEAVLAWIEGMRSGKAWDEALLAASLESLDVFDEQYRAWSTAHLKELTANRQVYLDAVNLLREQKEQQAVPLLDAFVAGYPLDLYAGNARYFLNYARFRLGEYEPAIDGFTDLVNNASATTDFQGKAHYFLGRAYQLAGYSPVAAGEFRTASLEPENSLLVKLAQQRLKETQ